MTESRELDMEPGKSKQKATTVVYAKTFAEDCSLIHTNGSRKREGHGVQAPFPKGRPPKTNWKASRQRQPTEKRVVCKTEDSLTTEDVASRSKGRAKLLKNASEMVNFDYGHASRRALSDAATNRRHRFNSVSYSREVFLQANCRFVVKLNEDYSKHAIDPDLPVGWDRIEQVHLDSDDTVSCPICLFPPTVARITKCGHVYCWSCIIHYLNLGTKSHRKCPICHDDIHLEDLRSVLTKCMQKYVNGEKVTMTLMRRRKGSINVDVLTSSSHSIDDDEGVEKAAPVRFSKLKLASCREVLDAILLPEKAMLSKQLATAIAENSGEEPYIELALAAILEKEALLLRSAAVEAQGIANSAVPTSGAPCQRPHSLSIGSPSDRSDKEPHEIGRPSCCTQYDNIATRRLWKSSISSDDSSLSSPADAVIADCYQEEQYHLAPPAAEENYYYFYQASDGQNIFMHPINVRCLVSEYGSLEYCPETITAATIAMETMTITKETRKKHRYLGHLPITCAFVICELMLKAPDLSKETLALFADEFRQRKQQRQQKRREEKKSDRKYEASQRFDSHGRAVTVHPTPPRLQFESLDEFPAQSSDVALPEPEQGPDVASLELSPSPPMLSTEEKKCQINSTPSFAQALSHAASTKVPWGMPAKQALCKQAHDGVPDKGENDYNENAAPSFADAFSMALIVSDQLGVGDEGDALRPAGMHRKQKKKEKQVLFTTGKMRKY